MSKRGHGIYFRKKENRYVGKCHAGRDENGKLLYCCVYARSYKEVFDKLNAKRLELANCVDLTIYKDGTLNDWLICFMSNHLSVKIKQSTRCAYESQIENHIRPLLGKLRLANLTTLCVSEFVSSLQNKGLSPVTIKNVYRLLKCILDKAQQKNLVHVNPCHGVILPKIEAKKTVPLTTCQQAILEKTNDVAVILSLFTGMRIGEISALRIENIDFARQTISVEKTLQRVSLANGKKKTQILITEPKSVKSKRIIPIPFCIIDFLKKHITSFKGFLLTNSERFIEPRTLQNRFKSLFSSLPLDYVNFHTLRHTFATRCLENRMDIKTLSEILGHSNAAITLSIYCHSCDEHKKECMNKLRFA